MINHFFQDPSPKKKTLLQLYRLIYKHGAVSKATLVKWTGIKQSTCSRLIDELLQSGLILEYGYEESSGGRRPLTYQIQPTVNYVAGIEISRTHSRVIVMDLSMTIIEETKYPMRQDSTPEKIVELIQSDLLRILQKYNITASKLLGIGVGAVGPLDREKGIILRPQHFPAAGWEHIAITEKLNQTFRTKVLLDNGANTAALGEFRNGLWKKADHLVYNIIGIGIRCGVLTNGKLVRGPVDMEGAFGHMVVDVQGRTCICGNVGCLSAYASILSVQQEVNRRLKKGQSSYLSQMKLTEEEVSYTQICEAVSKNDPLCIQVVKEAAYYYGVGLTNLMYLIHPDRIILGGALITDMDLFYEIATETARQRMKHYADYQIVFSRGLLGERAVAVGAARMILDYFMEEGA
ncbi:ROK family protein [Brevibacillus reuszeri]|uniref:ROK family transcriptional regulator n=1 Tax=Brevibacillus reuszeri TaxID=54915 RepID=UPI003671FE59